MSLFIDLHAHLEWFKDIERTIENARKAGLKIILASGTNKETNRFALKISKDYDIVKCSLGLYPIDALERETKKPQKIDIDKEIDFIKKNKDNIVAIGEVGLDYKENPDKEKQKEVFQKMVSLAEELKKPIIIHSRKAEEDAIKILESSNLKKIILHCFCGKKKLVERAMNNKWYFTIPTNIVRSQQFQEMAKIIDISHLFCETDSPFLSPFREKQNEPAFVIESYKKIAEIKGMELEEVANNIYMNWQKVF